MAMMQPDVDPDSIPHDSERIVYRALKEQLSNDYVVLHSYPWLRPDRDGALREGEADFVILHQSKGLLVLEVKGGELLYQNATWQRKKSFGYEPITDPFKQARNSMHYLVDRIELRTSGDVRASHFSYGHAVVFPHDHYVGDAPPGADESLILSHRDMTSIAPAIERAIESWPKKDEPLTNHQWRRLAAALLPEFKLFRPLVGTADDVFEKIQEMTDEQVDLLAGLYEANKRVYVTGVAGSGKTQIALDQAIASAQSGKRTLFVCYNKYLADHLIACVRKNPDYKKLQSSLKIRHFHGYARELIEDSGIKWNPPEGKRELEEFFINDVPDLMEQAAFIGMEDGEEVQFDALVIDEAQDFHSSWWEVLQCTLLKDEADGILLAFADPVQRLWDWAPENPPVSFGTRFVLKRNCRNSRWIARTSTTLAKTKAEFFKKAPLGRKPKLNTVSSIASMKGILKQAVAELMDSHDLSPSQIVLIGPQSYEKGSLADLDQIGGVPLTSDIHDWWRGNSLLVTTSKSFKGLEADAVLLYDLERLSAWFTKVDLYVACTRARSHVHFFVAGKEMISDINDAIKSVQQEFDE